MPRPRPDGPIVRALGRLTSPILLGRRWAQSLGLWVLHLGILALMLCLGGLGWWAGHHGVQGVGMAQRSALVALSYGGALSLFLLERLVAGAYGPPFTAEARSRSTLVRHPGITLILGLVLHLSTVLAAESLALVRGESTGWAAIGRALLVLAALPFWFVVVHPRRLWRGARAARGAPIARRGAMRGMREWAARGRETVVAPIRDIRAARRR